MLVDRGALRQYYHQGTSDALDVDFAVVPYLGLMTRRITRTTIRIWRSLVGEPLAGFDNQVIGATTLLMFLTVDGYSLRGVIRRWWLR